MKEGLQTNFALPQEGAVDTPAFQGDLIPGGLGFGGELVPLTPSEVASFDSNNVIDMAPATSDTTTFDVSSEGSNQQKLADINDIEERLKRTYEDIEANADSLDAERPKSTADTIPVGYTIVAEGEEGEDCVIINGARYCRVPSMVASTPGLVAIDMLSGLPGEEGTDEESAQFEETAAEPEIIETQPDLLRLTYDPAPAIEMSQPLAIEDMTSVSEAPGQNEP